MALNVKMNQKGQNAKNATANDLSKAIEEMEAAASELGKCTGLGTEIYLTRLDSLKEKFTKVRDRFNR
jgi:hypothetical protein